MPYDLGSRQVQLRLNEEISEAKCNLTLDSANDLPLLIRNTEEFGPDCCYSPLDTMSGGLLLRVLPSSEWVKCFCESWSVDEDRVFTVWNLRPLRSSISTVGTGEITSMRLLLVNLTDYKFRERAAELRALNYTWTIRRAPTEAPEKEAESQNYSYALVHAGSSS